MILSGEDKEIGVLKSQVTLLQNHVSTVKHALDEKVDEIEQYGKRVCLCIEGVEHKVNEKSEEVLEKVSNIIKESEAESRDTGKKMQSIIVRFTTFSHTTLFHTNRKKINRFLN